VLLVLLESPHWVGFNEGYLEIFRPKVDEILNLELFFLALEIQLNCKKCLCKEFTLGPMAHATLIYIIGRKLQFICAKFKMCTHPMCIQWKKQH